MGKGMILRYTLALLLLGATGCGWRRSHSGSDSSEGPLPPQQLTPVLTVQTQWPQDQDQDVALDAHLTFQFDSPINGACLADGLTKLWERDSGRGVQVYLELEQDNTVLRIRPDGGLEPETWYVCQLSALLCDRNERLLEEYRQFSFRTVDQTPPRTKTISLPQGATDVPRDVIFSFEFDELLDRDSLSVTSILLRDTQGREHPLRWDLRGTILHIYPVYDLHPGRDYVLVLKGGAGGICDRFGNHLPEDLRRDFRTAADTTPPNLLQMTPATFTVSPDAHINLQFSEAMDLDSIESSAFQFKDEYGNFVTYAVEAAPDRRLLRLVPQQSLVVGRQYLVKVFNGPGAITDLAGNTLDNTGALPLKIGTDRAAPALLTASPADQALRVSPNVTPYLDFDEALAPDRVHEGNIELLDAEGKLSFVTALEQGNTRLRIVPTEALQNGQSYELLVRGGPLGLADPYGNTMAQDIRIRFSTSTDVSLPEVTVSPTHGHSAVPVTTAFSAVFAEALDPTSVTAQTVLCHDGNNLPVAGEVILSDGDRTLVFEPKETLSPGLWYTVTLKGGPEGLRERSGNWFSEDLLTSFRPARTADTTKPELTLSVNETQNGRQQGLSVPSHGFSITLFAEDPTNYDLDLSSFEVEIKGREGSLSAAQVRRGAVVTKAGLSYVLPSNQQLAPGTYTLHASCRDLAGNEGKAEPLTFEVVQLESRVMPFERTQVVWVRFDLDRDENGRPDFEDDLYRLGLMAEGDPAGSNARMLEIMQDGVLAQAHLVYERQADGARLPGGSVPVFFSKHKPLGVRHAEIAIGGLDPSRDLERKFGDKSSGILGRAYFDRLNSSRTDNNTSMDPGLGVFSGELFLFEAESHLALYPFYVTAWAKKFLKLVPDMGGQPAGTHQYDARVLAPGFVVDKEPPAVMRRYFDVFLAADDWATAVGIILAHEVGHTIGLVATGTPPEGLHGDGSLHNTKSHIGNVMGAAVGYDALVLIKHRFRDINLAYLRQRILLK